MKIKKNILVLSVIVLTLTSCNDFLTQTPRSDLTASEYWKTERDVQNWMNGIYNGMVSGLAPNIRWWGEGRTDNLFPTIYGQGPAYQKNALTSSVGTTDWSDLYTIIARCNLALKYVPGMENLTDIKKEQFYAEIHGLRALMYFYIMRLWGDCPLILESWDLSYETRYNPRASVTEVAKAIEDDIDTSIGYFLSNGSRQTSVHYFNLSAAYALKMDFLAWEGRYDEIPGVYADFMAQGTFTLTATDTEWKNIFITPDESNESIFALAWDTNHSTSTYSTYASAIGFSGSNANFSLGRNMYALMVQDTMDIRLRGVVKRTDYNGDLIASNAPIYGATGGSNNNVQRIYKFLPMGAGYGVFVDESEYYFEPPIYRYAEVLLLYAEALNRMDDGPGAIQILNDIRASRGSSVQFDINDYPVKLGSGKTSRERLIMDERQLEFFGEGKRWFDLRRMDWGYDILDAHVEYLQYQDGDDITGFGSRNRLLFPIYLSNIANNSLLVQNPGY